MSEYYAVYLDLIPLIILAFALAEIVD